MKEYQYTLISVPSFTNDSFYHHNNYCLKYRYCRRVNKNETNLSSKWIQLVYFGQAVVCLFY